MITIDNIVTKTITGNPASATTAAFGTSPNVVLLAYGIGNSGGSEVVTISGGGLTWVRIIQTHTQLGSSEIWRSQTSAALSGATVTAAFSSLSDNGLLVVVSYLGCDMTGTNGSAAIGATATANAASGAPTASLTTTRPQSWVWGAGNTTGSATARTIGSGQAKVSEATDAADVADAWVQRQSYPTPSKGTSVTLNVTAPTADAYNLSLVELLPALGTTSQLLNRGMRPHAFSPGLAR